MKLYSDSIGIDDGFEEINHPTPQDIERVLHNVLTQEHERGFYLQLQGKQKYLGLYSPLFCTALPLDMIIDMEYVEESPTDRCTAKAPPDKRDILLQVKPYHLEDGNKVWKQVKKIDDINDIITTFQKFLTGNNGWKEYFKIEQHPVNE